MNITVKRTLKLLTLTAQADGPLSFSFLKENLYDITPAGLSRLLKELTGEGWLLKNKNGLYGAGSVFHNCVNQFSQRVPLAEKIRPVVERLAERSGHSATFVEYDKGGIYHRTKCEKEDSMHYADLNSRNERVLYNTMGRLCLAWQDINEIDRIFNLAAAEKAGETVTGIEYEKLHNKGILYKSSVENDSRELIASYRNIDMLTGFEPDMRTRICTALIGEGHFLGVMGITIPGPPLSEREETFFRKCLKKAIGEISL